MANSSLITDYLGVGTHAGRPATPPIVAGVAAFYYETDTGNTFCWSGSAWVQVNGSGASSFAYVCVQEQQTSGTAGGTFTSGAWQTRLLSTITADSAALASLASHQVTLPAGTYRAHASASAALVNQHQTRLRDVTGGATLLLGSSEYAQASSGVVTSSLIQGRFVLSVSSALELQHQCNATRATNGFGNAAGFGQSEVYAQIEFWKE